MKKFFNHSFYIFSFWLFGNYIVTAQNVNCATDPMVNGDSFSFGTTLNGIQDTFNATTSIWAANEINNTKFLAPEITLYDGFKASVSSGQEVFISTTNCPANTQTADLMIRDLATDTGTEPSTFDFGWDSPDIWVRNNNDNGTTHQAPINGQENWIYVKVKNIGNKASSGYEKLTVYRALTTVMNVGRCGVLLGTNNANSSTQSIPTLAINAEQIFKFAFTPNGALEEQQTIQAEISDAKPHGNPICSLMLCHITGSKKLALRNVVFVNPQSGSAAGVLVGNPFPSAEPFDLELYITDTETGKPVYLEAEVTIKMDDVLLQAWERGNKTSERLGLTNEENKRVVLGNEALFKNLILYPNELGKIEFSFNFLMEEYTNKTKYSYHLIQKKSQTAEIVGGTTFTIDKDLRDTFEAQADDKLADLNENITIAAQDIGEAAVYNWYDSEGNLVGQGKNLEIANAVAEQYKLEVISSVDGFKDYTDVEVKIKPNRLINLFPNPSNNNINVEYKINEGSSAYLMVLNFYMNGSASNNYVLDINSNAINIDLNSYPLGFYKVLLVVDGAVVDAKILSKY